MVYRIQKIYLIGKTGSCEYVFEALHKGYEAKKTHCDDILELRKSSY